MGNRPLLFMVGAISAQFAPVGANARSASLQLRRDAGAWKLVATAAIDPHACNAVLRVPGWNAGADYAYRLFYQMPGGTGALREHVATGTISNVPVEKPEITNANSKEISFPCPRRCKARVRLPLSGVLFKVRIPHDDRAS
jgi:hypothetical protein